MRFITRFALAALIACLMLFAANAVCEEEVLSPGAAWDERYGNGEQPGDDMGLWTVVECEDSEPMYELPDDASPILTRLPEWTEVQAYYYDTEWFECEWEGLRGFISRAHLTDRPGKYVDWPGNLELEMETEEPAD